MESDYKTMWEESQRHLRKAEARARRYMRVVIQIEEILAELDDLEDDPEEGEGKGQTDGH